MWLSGPAGGDCRGRRDNKSHAGHHLGERREMDRKQELPVPWSLESAAAEPASPVSIHVRGSYPRSLGHEPVTLTLFGSAQ